MSKYIYINSFSEKTPNNTNIGIVFLENIRDFECQFTDNPLQFKVYNTSERTLTWNVSVDNNVISDSDAKTLTDKAFSRTYINALTNLNSVVNFFPPNGVTIGAQI